VCLQQAQRFVQNLAVGSAMEDEEESSSSLKTITDGTGTGTSNEHDPTITAATAAAAADPFWRTISCDSFFLFHRHVHIIIHFLIATTTAIRTRLMKWKMMMMIMSIVFRSSTLQQHKISLWPPQERFPITITVDERQSWQDGSKKRRFI
jgi:hypothetical protein